MFQSKLHHVGIIIPDVAQMDALAAVFGLERGSEQYVKEYEAQCYFTRGSGAVIEFIVPLGGTLATFNKGIGGLHHIALEVDDLAYASEQLRNNEIKLLEDAAVDAGPILINFVPPAYTRGLRVELVQRKTGETLRNVLGT